MYRIIESTGHLLHRIEAMSTMCFIIKPGTKGGWIESLGPWSLLLVIYGNAVVKGVWLCHHAKVFGNARVIGEAIVSDEAVLCHYYGICYC